MAHYIDADKLIAEIKRQRDYYDKKEQDAWDNSDYGDDDAIYYQGKRMMCKTLLSFIDSLQQKLPEVDLEKEIDNYFFHAFRNFRRGEKCAYVDMGDGKEWVPVEDWKITKRKMDKDQLIHFARHFFELRLKAKECEK